MNTKEVSSYELQANEALAKMNVKFTATFLKFGKHFEDDTQPRNIFSCEFSRDGKSFKVDFGSSIQDSCNKVTVPQKEVNENIEVFAGLKTKNGGFASVKFNLLKKYDFNISDEKMIELETQMKDDFYASMKGKNQAWKKKFDNGTISKNEMMKNMVGKIEDGAFSQCILNAIRRELEKPIEKYIENSDKKTPTAYDVITCIQKYDIGTFEDFCSEFGYGEDSRKAENIYKAVCKEWRQVEAFFTPDEIEILQEIQ